MDPDPDSGGPKTYLYDGSGFGSGSATLVPAFPCSVGEKLPSHLQPFAAFGRDEKFV